MTRMVGYCNNDDILFQVCPCLMCLLKAVEILYVASDTSVTYQRLAVPVLEICSWVRNPPPPPG